MSRANVTIIIPAYNESRAIGKVVAELKRYRYNSVIVVDDGSSDETSEVAHRAGAYVFRHMINRGLGGAIGTGIRAALANCQSQLFITIDADGQHDVRDIKRMLNVFDREKCDVVIGSRMVSPEGMPWHRQAANHFSNIITRFLFGVWTSDSQSGFRGFTREAAEKINIQTNRMEVSSEIFREIKKHGLVFREIPIRVIYTTYSLSKGQSFRTGLQTLSKLIIYRLMHH